MSTPTTPAAAPRTIRVRATVGPDHAIHIPAGDFQVGEEVAVTIVVEAPTLPPSKSRSVLEIIDSLPPHRNFKTAEEVDAYINQERDSWER
jgi:hypothetical protein